MSMVVRIRVCKPEGCYSSRRRGRNPSQYEQHYLGTRVWAAIFVTLLTVFGGMLFRA
jgi:hypothetical protein